VRCARMQDVRIAQKLNVADLENHVQGEFQAGVLQDLGGVHLRGRQRRDLAGAAESRERLDVVGIPFRVDSSVGTGFFVEDGLAGVRLFAFGDLAFAVEVPDGLSQGVYHIRVLAL